MNKKKLTEMITKILNEDISVGKFYYDNRKDKTFRIISVDGTDRNGNRRLDKKTDIGIQYYDFKTKRPIGNIETVDKSEFDYMVSKGQWSEWKQDFFSK